MPHFATASAALNPTLHSCSPEAKRSATDRGLRAYRSVFLVTVVLCFVLSGAMRAPGQASASSSSTSGMVQSQDNGGDGSASSVDGAEAYSPLRTAPLNPGEMALSTPLSAEQIVSILQENPDLVVEIKSVMADRLQEQGTSIDATEISDEMLYRQIASSASLRANVSAFLRARGYVPVDNLSSPSSELPVQEAEDGAPLERPPRMQPNTEPEAENVFPAEEQINSPGEFRKGLFSGSERFSGHPGGEVARERNETVNASTDLPRVLRQAPPYDLEAMRDLYAQISEASVPLKRFGSELFTNDEMRAATLGISTRNTLLDVPVGPDYIVGSGDTLTIDLWGSVTQSIKRSVDSEGRVFLPESGSVSVAGLTLAQAEERIGGALKQQYRSVQVAVTVSRMRSVRVYVVGDVQRPGGYDISSLATALSALYAAGGPTGIGSLRLVRHLRGQKLVEEVDLYDLLLHGMHSSGAHFESGDTLEVPPAGPQIAISGAVKRPAIYELKPGETTLAALVEDAGGFTPAASLSHIIIERIDPNQRRETVALKNTGDDSPGAERAAIDGYELRDGDRIRVEPVLPYSQRAVYLQGHVVRPGRIAFTDGMRLSDVLHSYRDLLPEPASHGEIVRLVPPDLHPETTEFSVPDVLIGNANVDLQPFDTIRIFGRYQVDAPRVTIRGEVLRPGVYPMSKGMTAAQLVRMAGGFRRDALQDSADLATYRVVNGEKIAESLAAVPIGAAVAGTDAHADVALKPGDVITIHQITGWNDIGESVTIQGEVRYPGSYGFRDGEHLSSVLRRAGGILPTGYPMGAVMVRSQVKELEEKSRQELIRQIETNSAAARLSPSVAGSGGNSALQLIKAQQDEVVTELKDHPPSGRMVIQISADIDSWANTPADIELRQGDVLTIPKRPGFVLVTGQVYNATALAFTPNKSAGWYLNRAGGANKAADRKDIFIIRANGSVVGRHSGGLFDADVLSTRLSPGDVVVVPQKILGASLFWRNLLTTGQIAASLAITAGVASTAL